MKTNKISFVGLILYALSFASLLAGYILAILSFKAFSIDVDRFVIILPIFAMINIVLQIVMSLIDENKPKLFNVLSLAVVILIVFTFAKTITPFLTPIGIYFSGVNMGDIATYQRVVPMSITSAIILIVSAIIYIVGTFFPITSLKGREQE